MTAGEVYLDGKELFSLPEQEMRKIRGNGISMIFQDPMTALNPVQTVGDQIAEVVKLHNTGSKTDFEKKAKEMLEMVGIPGERYHEYPHQFSGGMKQRVVIAIALACNPGLLLADEPTTALDVTIQAEVVREMKKLREQYETAIILVTHNMGVASYISDKIGVMCKGELVEFGKRDDVIFHPKHEYTKKLLAAVPRLEGKRFAK